MEEIFRFQNIIHCQILERINRFTVKILKNNEEDLALLTNTGRLKDIIYKGNIGICLKKDKVKKLRYVLLGTYVKDDNYTLIDTRYQMIIFEKLFNEGKINWLKNANFIKRNVKVFNSFIDYLFKKNNGEDVYLEIKSAVLFDGYYSMYPDCPSLRGRKHVIDLINISNEGKKSMIAFISAHPEAKAFKPSKEGDEKLYYLISEAYSSKSIEIHAIKFYLKANGSVIFETDNLPIEI